MHMDFFPPRGTGWRNATPMAPPGRAGAPHDDGFIDAVMLTSLSYLK